LRLRGLKVQRLCLGVGAVPWGPETVQYRHDQSCCALSHRASGVKGVAGPEQGRVGEA
jgi:hypothetical protein